MADDFYQEYGPIERRRRGGAETAPLPTVSEWPDDQLTNPGPRHTMPARKKPRRRLRMFLWGSGITLLLLVLLAGGGLWYLNRTFDGRIYPNVAVQGVDLSRMTPDEARAAIN